MSDQRLKNTFLTISLRLKEHLDEGSMPKLVELLLREGVVFLSPFCFASLCSLYMPLILSVLLIYSIKLQEFEKDKDTPTSAFRAKWWHMLGIAKKKIIYKQRENLLNNA